MLMAATGAKAQMRSAYFIDTYTMAHEMNPALQPDSSYMTIPILGNTYAGIGASLSLDDILFETSDGSLTTFMSKGTISKQDLLDRVGNGVTVDAGIRLTLLSIGRRLSAEKYQTLGVTLRTDANGYLPKGLFDCMKDIENKNYNIDNAGAKASAYMEIAAGESRKLNRKITVGAKAKMLIGLLNADIGIDNITLNISGQDTWTANGKAKLNVSGPEYKTETKTYNGRPESYEQVTGIENYKFGIHGIGLAIDGGITYKADSHWTLSAAITDLGFVTWLKSHKAGNNGETFTFSGFQNIEVEKSDENSLKQQWDNMHDDLMELAHLEEQGNTAFTKLLGATVNIGAMYFIDPRGKYRAGALLTGRIDGKYSWWETRVNAMIRPISNHSLDICLSPYTSTFGTGIGAAVNYMTKKGINVYLACDRLFLKVNPQMLPTSLNGTIQFGMSLKI